MEKAIKAAKVAELLGINVKTVYQAARNGTIPCCYPLGRPKKKGERKPVSFYLSQIEKYLNENNNIA